jgi:TetR/AcrR family transcriptional regulator
MAGLVSPRSLPTGRHGIAERLWQASRVEFSQRGYHGARVQGIARRAGCNVALLYRHWTSKKALYLDLLRSVWQDILGEVLALMQQSQGARAVVGAYLEANLRDPVGAQILIREVLDGAPFLSQLVAVDPGLAEPVQRAARALASQEGAASAVLRPGPDAVMSVLSIAGLAALVASAHEASRPFLPEPISPDAWRQHVYGLLLHGVLARGEAASAAQ